MPARKPLRGTKPIADSCSFGDEPVHEFEEIAHESGYRKIRIKRRAEIDPEAVYKLAQIDASPVEIAFVLNCDYATLIRHYQDVIDSGHSDLRVKIRRRLTQKALAGDMAAMKIYADTKLGYNAKLVIEQTTTIVDDSDLVSKLADIDSTKLTALLIEATSRESANQTQH